MHRIPGSRNQQRQSCSHSRSTSTHDSLCLLTLLLSCVAHLVLLSLSPLSSFPTFYSYSARTALAPSAKSTDSDAHRIGHRIRTVPLHGSDAVPVYAFVRADTHTHTDIRISVRLRSQSRLRRLSSLPCPVLAPPLGRSLSASLSLSALASPFPRLPAARCLVLSLAPLSRTHSHIPRSAASQVRNYAPFVRQRSLRTSGR